ncbi:hypothetical protein COI44_08670 [Bacillus sp. AFS088145]|nr:hypothetical protein COI44_08670 [Bacillus sp. AFS088145]
MITLPVEYNASSRAKTLMLAINDTDRKGVNKVLGAAALTYLAATLISVLVYSSKDKLKKNKK